MPNTTISQLPAATSLGGSEVVAADNSSGTTTEKVTLLQIVALAFPAYANNNDVLTYDSGTSSWIAAAPQGGLPTGTNQGDLLYWDAGNATWLTGSLSTILPTATSNGDVLTWDSTASAWTAAAATGIPLPASPNQGDVLTYDTGSWIAQAPSGGLPSGSAEGQVLTWSDMSGSWSAQAIPAQLPTSANTNDILAWNGAAWGAVLPYTPGLPYASAGQYLTYDGTNWIAGNSPLPSGSSQGQTLFWNYQSSSWSAAPIQIQDWNSQVGYEQEQLAAYDGRLWRCSSSNMGNTPADGSSYWTPLTATPLPSGAINNGDLLTYNSSTSSWAAAAPPATVSRFILESVADQSTTNGSDSSSYLTITMSATSATWQVEGLAYLYAANASGEVNFHLQFGNSTADGSISLDMDVCQNATTNQYTPFFVMNPTNQSVAYQLDPNQAGQFFAIRFKALVRTASNPNANFFAAFGASDNDNTVTLKTGSWMSGIRLS